MPWERPADVPTGQVWSRFEGRERNGKPANKYQIRDMVESHEIKCLSLMEEIFLRDEPLCEALGITKDPESVATIRCNWEGFLSQGVSLACYTEVDGAPDELVAFNVIMVKTLHDEEEDLHQVRGEAWRKLLLTLMKAEEKVDVFELYGIEEYLTSSGLTVVPEHRGQNIGARLFHARKGLCKALGIQATATVFTAATSQALAHKCGYDVLAEMHYSEMQSYDVNLTRCPTLTAKVMGTKFNFNK